MPKDSFAPKEMEVKESDSWIAGHEEAMAKIAISLSETKDIETMSHLSFNEILVVASLLSAASELNSDVLQSVVNHYIRLKVSYKRMGRKELKDIATSTHETITKSSKIKSLFGME